MQDFRSRLATLAVMLLSLGFSSCAHRAAVWAPDFSANRLVLPNGLTVLFVEDRSSTVVSVTTWFKIGSAWEKRGSTGIAHLFEHMMFKGTPRFPGKTFTSRLERKGAVVNAYTHQDATVYYEIVGASFLEPVIEMEADRLANLSLTQADLDAEREVVKAERRLRVDSDFGAQQSEALAALAFPHHPYGWPIIGYEDDLSKLTLEQCRAFFKTYYQPGNAIVTIAGAFDYEQARGWVKKYYGAIPGHPVTPLELPPARVAGREKRAEIRKPVRAEALQMGYLVPSMYDADAEPLALLAWTLFGMSSSRAREKLVREDQIVLDVGADVSLKRFPNLFVIWAEMKEGVPAARAEREIERLIESVKTRPPGLDELARVRRAIRYAIINEAKSPLGMASWLTGGEFYWRDHRRFKDSLERYDRISPEELSAVARRHLNKANRVVVVMKPERKGSRR